MHRTVSKSTGTPGRGGSTCKKLVYPSGSAPQVSLCQSLNAVFMVFGELHFVVGCIFHHKRSADQEASSMQPRGTNFRCR